MDGDKAEILSMSAILMTKNDMPEPPLEPRKLGFLLIDNFALMSFASAIEPFRAANVLAGRELYSWVIIGVDHHGAKASAGLSVQTQCLIGADLDLDTLFVCVAGNPAEFTDEAALQWLRRLARRGVRIGGVSGGPFILARAGLLDGYRCTVHWEHVPAFRESFPHLTLRRSLYEIDRDRLTCAGGIAALDMMHALIAAEQGRALADKVSEWFLQTQIRLGTGAQRRSLQERYDTANAHLLTALELVESHVEHPMSRRALAQAAGISVRQLERLFAQHLDTTLDGHYREIRLDRARTLLRQTVLPVAEVALASGFQSASHFSRQYKNRFGYAPGEERRTKAQRKVRAGRAGR
jgi:transcriptional regulator GlxA family with amidase domain